MTPANPSSPPRLGWSAATAVALLFLVTALLFHWRELEQPRLLDFTNFYATGRLALAGEAASAYDSAGLAAAQAAVVGPTGAEMPYPYPPAFMLLTAPFAFLSYPLALAAWVLCGAFFYLWASRRFGSLPLAAAQPPVLLNAMIGQTGFLTGGLLLLGSRWLAERPDKAGLLLGLLVLKPQLALMLPVAVVAARAWAAIPAAIASAAAVLLLGTLLLGIDTAQAFLASSGDFTALLTGDRLTWPELASPFALARDLGLGAGPAAIIQLAFMAFAATLVWLSWRGGWEQRVPILCVASLAASPYLQSYDSLPLLAAIAWFATTAPAKALLLYGLSALPLVSQSELASLPNSLPLATLLALLLLWHERRSQQAQITPTRLPAASNMPRISPT